MDRLGIVPPDADLDWTTRMGIVFVRTRTSILQWNRAERRGMVTDKGVEFDEKSPDVDQMMTTGRTAPGYRLSVHGHDGSPGSGIHVHRTRAEGAKGGHDHSLTCSFEHIIAHPISRMHYAAPLPRPSMSPTTAPVPAAHTVFASTSTITIVWLPNMFIMAMNARSTLR